MLVLVIDDDTDAREALGDVLEDEGFSVVGFGNGVSALEWIEAGGRADAILVDQWMRGMTGLDFQQKLNERSLLPGARCFLMTADHDIEAVPEGVIVVRKPFDLDDLKTKLTRVATSGEIRIDMDRRT